MVNRVSINALLKTVIVTLAAAIVVVLAHGAWQSWNRLASVSRISAVANASGYLFTGLHNLRVDRAQTNRDLNSEKPVPQKSPLLQKTRTEEMPALKAGLAALAATDFPGRQKAVTDLGQAIANLETIHQQADAAFVQPKSERPPGLAKEAFKAASDLIKLLDQISSQLTRSVKLQDAYIDQLMELKELAWVARNAGGDTSLMVSNALGGIPLPPDAMQKYTSNVSRLNTAWAALENLAAGLPLPAQFSAAVDKAKQEFFGQDYVDLRLKTLKALIAHQPVSIKVNEWSPMSVGKLASLLSVAEVALDVAKQYTANQRAEALRAMWIELGFLVAAIALALGMILLVSRRVTGPLRALQQAMLKVAAGDFDVVLPGLDRKDEIGGVANAVERFKVLADEKARAEAEGMAARQAKQNEEAMQQQRAESERQAQAAAERAKAAEELMRQQELQAQTQADAAAERQKASEEQARVLGLLADGLKRLSEGDLTVKLDDGISQEYRQIKDDFNTAIDRLSETIRAIMDSSNEVANATGEISASTTDLSQRTEEQAASLEETSASMEEIAATVKQNAENAQQANQSASATRDVADRGGQVVAKAVEAMARIEDSSGKISDIIGVIDEIARQTNLLALNAAVEAARAGDAGRGFAVVASEVRSLAQRSSQAAKDIKDLITNSNGQVKEGVDLVNRAGTALNEIVDSIKKVADIVSDITTASTEQSTGIEQVNRALTQMDEVTQQNSALVEENAATAKTLEQHARAMDERISFFRLTGTGGRMAPAANVAPARPAPAARPNAPAAKPSAVLPPTRGPAAKANGHGGPVGRMQTALASAVNGNSEWKDF